MITRRSDYQFRGSHYSPLGDEARFIRETDQMSVDAFSSGGKNRLLCVVSRVRALSYEQCSDNRAEADRRQDKSDRVKKVPPVAEVRPVRRKRFRRPRIDSLVDWVDPQGPDKHHDQDAAGGEGREDGHHGMPPIRYETAL